MAASRNIATRLSSPIAPVSGHLGDVNRSCRLLINIRCVLLALANSFPYVKTVRADLAIPGRQRQPPQEVSILMTYRPAQHSSTIGALTTRRASNACSWSLSNVSTAFRSLHLFACGPDNSRAASISTLERMDLRKWHTPRAATSPLGRVFSSFLTVMFPAPPFSARLALLRNIVLAPLLL